MKKDNETFKQLMKASKWKKHYYMPTYSSEDVYVLNGFTAYFHNYYMVVHGQMPMDKAMDLYNLSDESLAIRVNGGGNVAPTKGHSKELMEYLDEIILTVSLAELQRLCDIREAELLKSNPKDFFIETYHIDTWAGFAKFSEFISANEIKSTWFD